MCEEGRGKEWFGGGGGYDGGVVEWYCVEIAFDGGEI